MNSASNTDLFTDGPPAIAQVRLTEDFMDVTGTSQQREVFAFGTHPMASSDEEHQVSTALASGNKLRVIVDHLLRGNRLQEIQCRDIVGPDGAFSTVADDATPDDIARCSVASDALGESCPGSNPRSVCICQIDAGCGSVAKGDPVGVLDVNQDGAADAMQLIKGSVGLKCGSIDVPIDLAASYWNPSGNQQVPAKGGFDALGPAIVIQPATPANGNGKSALPTNLDCTLTFSPMVVDKRDVQICAPANGDYKSQPYCTPGDVSQFKFHVEPLQVLPQAISDGTTGVSTTDPIILGSNVPVDATTITKITLVDSTGTAVAYTPSVSMGVNIFLTQTAPLAANTMYTLTIPTTVTDTFGQGMPMPVVIHFTTGA